MTLTLTIEADDATIAAARERARASNTTLEQELQRWLAEYSVADSGEARVERARATLASLRSPTRGRIPRFSKAELNER